MSFSMQARAVPAARLPQDFAGVSAVFADTDDELDRLETDLHISKDFSDVHELCLTAPPGHGSGELPVFGGEIHEDPAGIEAPSLTLTAAQVREVVESSYAPIRSTGCGTRPVVVSPRTGGGRSPRSAPCSPPTSGDWRTSTSARRARATRW